MRGPAPVDGRPAVGTTVDGDAAARLTSRYLALPTRTFWRSLRYLAVARCIVAGLILAYVPLLGREASLVDSFDRPMFLAVAAIYLLFASLVALIARLTRRGFHAQLLVGVVVDVLLITLIVSAAGGSRSGLGLMLVMPVAGAAILSTPLLSLFVAALASLALLAESGWQLLQSDPSVGIGNEVVVSAVISAVLLFTGILVNQLARRLSTQEQLAIRRGADLRNEVAVNELVIAVLDQGVLVFDPQGRLKAMNPMARAMLGLDPHSALTAASPDVLTAVRHVIDSGRLRDEIVLEDGAHRRLRVRMRVLNAQPGSDESSLRVDRVVLLEDLEALEERAQQLKLASMGRLSASIAHEIRNPLGAIRHAGNLLGEQLSDARLRRMTTIIEENTLRIDRIIGDVLSLARRSAEREPVTPAAFFNTFLPEFVAQADASWERIVVDLQSTDQILFDPNHLRQVLVNLLTNALRYASDTPGAVRICWLAINERQTVLQVMDDGPGISSLQRQHLFEPFFTTESRGTGLGLHMSRELCSANGADLRYESLAEGRYAGRFTIEPERRRGPEVGGRAPDERVGGGSDDEGGQEQRGQEQRGKRDGWQTPMTA